MNRLTHTAKALLGACVIATAMLAGGVAGARQSAAPATSPAPEPPSPATGHAEVVATWLVDFADGAYEWTVTEHSVDAAGIDLTHSVPTFLIGDGDLSTVITGPEVRGRLADGEALFRRPTLTTHAAALGGEPATLMEWTISTPPGDAGTGAHSDPIEPGAGAHDIDIIRDWLAAGETFTMRAGIPAFVMVTSGWVTTADGTRIDAGGWATLEGDIALTNGGDEPATLLAAWISPVIEIPPVAPPPSTTAAVPTTAPPAPTAAPVAPATTVAPVTTVAETATTVGWTTTTVPAPETTWAPTTTQPGETSIPWPTTTTTQG